MASAPLLPLQCGTERSPLTWSVICLRQGPGLTAVTAETAAPQHHRFTSAPTPGIAPAGIPTHYSSRQPLLCRPSPGVRRGLRSPAGLAARRRGWQRRHGPRCALGRGVCAVARRSGPRERRRSDLAGLPGPCPAAPAAGPARREDGCRPQGPQGLPLRGALLRPRTLLSAPRGQGGHTDQAGEQSPRDGTAPPARRQHGERARAAGARLPCRDGRAGAGRGGCAWERPPGRIAGRLPCPARPRAPAMLVGNVP